MHVSWQQMLHFRSWQRLATKTIEWWTIVETGTHPAVANVTEGVLVRHVQGDGDVKHWEEVNEGVGKMITEKVQSFSNSLHVKSRRKFVTYAGNIIIVLYPFSLMMEYLKIRNQLIYK